MIKDFNQPQQLTLESLTHYLPSFIYNDKMTLQDYIESKNLQRRMEYRLLNYEQKIKTALTDQKQYEFEKQIHDIKGFIRHIIGDGSLFNKFVIMIDNLYNMFMKEISVYHQLRIKREEKVQDVRIKEFRQANEKLQNYLKECEEDSRKTEEKLQFIKKARFRYLNDMDNRNNNDSNFDQSNQDPHNINTKRNSLSKNPKKQNKAILNKNIKENSQKMQNLFTNFMGQ